MGVSRDKVRDRGQSSSPVTSSGWRQQRHNESSWL